MTLRVACMMMQKNELELLETWLAYHGALLGFENMYVFDNGSTDFRCLQTLQKYSIRGVNVSSELSGPDHYKMRGELLSAVAKAIQASGRYDLLLTMDCDEFLFRYIHGQPSADRAVIASHLQALSQRPGTVRIHGQLTNIIGRTGFYATADVQKTAFRLDGTFHETDHGFHNTTTTQGLIYQPSELGYLHFHYKPLATLRAHAKARLAAFVDVEDPKALASYDGPSSYAVRYINMSDQEYADWHKGATGVQFPSFERALNRLGHKLPF